MKKRRSVIIIILSVIMCLPLFVSCFATAAVYGVYALRGSNVTKALAEIVTDIVAESEMMASFFASEEKTDDDVQAELSDDKIPLTELPDGVTAEVLAGMSPEDAVGMIPDGTDIGDIIESLPEGSTVDNLVEQLPEGTTMEDIIENLPEDTTIEDVIEKLPEGTTVEDIIEKLPEDSIVEDIIENLPEDTTVEDIVENLPEGVEVPDDIGEALDDIANGSFEDVAEKYGVTKEQVNELIEKMEVKEFLGEKLNDYVDGVISGAELTETITKEEIIDFIKEKEEVIEEVTGHKMTEENYETIDTYIEESKVIETVTQTVVAEENKQMIELVRFVLSPTLTLIAGGVCLFFILVILLLNVKHISDTLLYAGIPMLVTGLIFGVASLSTSVAVDLITSMGGGELPVTAAQLGTLVNALFGGFRTAAIVLVAAAIVMIALKIIVSIVKKKKSADAE